MAGDVATAIAEAEAAVAEGRRSSSPMLLMYALRALAYALMASDATRARAILLESVAYEAEIGPRYVDNVNHLMAALVGAFVGEPDVALRAAATIMDRGPTGNPLAVMTLFLAVAACIAESAPEDALVVYAVVDSTFPGLAHWPLFAELRAPAQKQITAAVDPTHLETLRTRATSMTYRDACAYVETLITNALDRRRHLE